MKKTLSMLVLSVLFAAVTLNAQESSYLRTGKNKLLVSCGASIGYATGMGDMNKFLSNTPEFFGKFDDMQFLQGGIGWGFDLFFYDSWAYYIYVEAYRGDDMSAADNIHATMSSFGGKIGAEYFFYKKRDLALSANLCIGLDEIDFDYGMYNGRWLNYTLPVGFTFWYRGIGFNLNYSPAIFRTEPNETPVDMPKMSVNNIDLTIRFAF